MMTTLDIQLVQKRIDALRVPATSIASLTGITSTQLSDWLRGARPLPAERISRINRTLTDVEEIAASCRPLILDMRNPILLQMWLDLWRENNLRIKIDDLSEAEATKE